MYNASSLPSSLGAYEPDASADGGLTRSIYTHICIYIYINLCV